MNFNKAQLEAISFFNGPALVLAGPGSGKTAVVTHRVKYLIEEYHVNPSNILVITFTKAAATEMKNRFVKLMNGKSAPVSFGTFHGVYFTILKHAYNYSAKNIISEEEQIYIITRIINKMHIECDNEKEFAALLLSEISKVKGDRIDINNYFSTNCGQDEFRKIFLEYNRNLAFSKKIDFDDMICYCYELFTQRKDILNAWQEKYRYILIDEFQDINKVQYDVIKLLAMPKNNLFIVGDDDQSIYSFRGAKPEIMLNFPNEYKNAKVINLDVNYRCQANIVKGAANVINNNEKRFKKNITAASIGSEPIHVKLYDGVYEEAVNFIRQINEYHNNNIAYGKMAVLTRTNEGVRYFLEKMMEYNIPFKAKDTIPSIYSHWIAKNIFAYINMALGNRDRNVFLQIMNKPKRYIGRDVLNGPVIDFNEIRREYVNDRAWMLDRIDQFESDLKIIGRLNPFGAINYIRRGVGYDEYLKEYALSMQINEDELFDIVSELAESAREFNDFSSWFKHIENYEAALKSNNEKKNYANNNDDDAVNIITMHGAKGLEFDVVFIIDANESVIPYKKAILNNEIEEERRMFYVAMTRAKKYLHIGSVKNRFNKEVEVSRFVTEISKK